MGCVYSNEHGQVIKVTDAIGTYYYVVDGLGEPTCGGYLSEETACNALEMDPEDAPDGEVDMNADGSRCSEEASKALDAVFAEAVDKAVLQKLAEATLTAARTFAHDFVAEFGEPFDSAETDWDATAWGEFSRKLNLTTEQAEALWPVFSAELEAETRRIFA